MLMDRNAQEPLVSIRRSEPRSLTAERFVFYTGDRPEKKFVVSALNHVYTRETSVILEDFMIKRVSK